jgi:hypothetical protein
VIVVSTSSNEVFVINYEGGSAKSSTEGYHNHYTFLSHPNNFIYWSNGTAQEFVQLGEDSLGQLILGTGDNSTLDGCDAEIIIEHSGVSINLVYLADSPSRAVHPKGNQDSAVKTIEFFLPKQ